MEQLDSEYEYVARERDPRARFNWLYVVPVLGGLWLLFLLVAAIFQIPISGVVDPIMSLMIVLFLVMAGLLFYALAPQPKSKPLPPEE